MTSVRLIVNNTFVTRASFTIVHKDWEYTGYLMLNSTAN